jgi:signal transduction histidine kinase/CheY-like chemotaxis protein/HPt (histidine-containing phosphotransfer) domain-containing protein
MSEPPAAARAHEPESDPDPRSLILEAMHFAVMERLPSGAFEFVGRIPEWFLVVVPKAESMQTRHSLLDRFPLFEVFVPDAEEFWAKSADGRIQSDFWTESDKSGSEYHLVAYAINAGQRHYLLFELANETYEQRQLLIRYSHEQVLQNELIKRLNREVERANRAKSDFLASMSHEIRTPMNSMMGMADLLAESDLNSVQKKYVEIFQRAGSNLLDLINDILDLSKVEAGALTLETVRFELADVVGRAIELVKVRSAEKRLDVTSFIAPGVPEWLVGDPTRVRQVLLNLLGNAIKFTNRGGIRVEVDIDRDSDQPGRLRFAVRDTGIGIPWDKLNSVFDTFTQADSSTTRNYGGTGLGLSISKKLIELMNGYIWAESELGVGSTFYFIAEFGIAAPPVEVAVKQEKAEDTAKLVALPALHLLLADDSEDNRFLVREYLKNSGCHLDVAENGAVALERAISNHYDLIMMDVHMPVMDGYAAASRIREWEKANQVPSVPLVALTADAFDAAADKARQFGFQAHLTKPIRKSVLLESIKKFAAPCQLPSAPSTIPVQIDHGIAHLAPRYLGNVRRDLEELSAAEKKFDFETIRRLGHNLKGTGGSYGFSTITTLGTALEQAAKVEDIEQAREAIVKLQEYLRRVRVEQH